MGFFTKCLNRLRGPTVYYDSFERSTSAVETTWRDSDDDDDDDDDSGHNTSLRSRDMRSRRKGFARDAKNNKYSTTVETAATTTTSHKLSTVLTYTPKRVYNLGEKGSGFRTRAGVQDYETLRRELWNRRELFEDPEFPSAYSSLSYKSSPRKPYVWMRPKEIASAPRFFVQSFSRFDVQQGELGDCWLLAALSCITFNRTLFQQVVPLDQDFENRYAGIFHFRFWQFGKWVDVVVDDRLPTLDGKLAFLHSSERDEFWSALLEKAYAKLHGSYEALEGGSSTEALQDFTGGFTEVYHIRRSPPNLYTVLTKACERSSLICTAIEAGPAEAEHVTPDGLVKGHAYSITGMRLVQTTRHRQPVTLVRLRNPWGNNIEWKGVYSDRSPAWHHVPSSEKEHIELTFHEDGEFWMSYEDYVSHFDTIDICNLSPESFSGEELRAGSRKTWKMSAFDGAWVSGVTAGGCANFQRTFAHNPQYRVTLRQVDEGEAPGSGRCTAVVALMQKHRRSQMHKGVALVPIGFMVLHLSRPDRAPQPMDAAYLYSQQPVAVSPFVNLREMTCRLKLPPGSYCIVPSTFEPNIPAEFLLRVFSEHANEMTENDGKIQIAQIKPTIMTTEMNKPGLRTSTKNAFDHFLEIAGEDLEVDWKQLQVILGSATKNEAGFVRFGRDVCRTMVTANDADFSGKLGFEEFKSLWRNVCAWTAAFKQRCDTDSELLSPFDLREALSAVGYTLNGRLLNTLGRRFGSADGSLTFEEFLTCVIKVKAMAEAFSARDAGGVGMVTHSLEEWLQVTLYS